MSIAGHQMSPKADISRLTKKPSHSGIFDLFIPISSRLKPSLRSFCHIYPSTNCYLHSRPRSYGDGSLGVSLLQVVTWQCCKNMDKYGGFGDVMCGGPAWGDKISERFRVGTGPHLENRAYRHARGRIAGTCPRTLTVRL